MIAADLFEQAGRQLADWRRTLILTHDRPDGDAIGAVGGMKRIIDAAGGRADGLISGHVPERYAALAATCGLGEYHVTPAEALDGLYDGILILDTRSWTQLETPAPYLRASARPRIVLDHHATGDDLSTEQAEALCLVDSSAASACGLVCQWAQVMGWHIDAVAGSALFTGMATDTGWFRFSNTDPATLRMAADLLERGQRVDLLYSRLYESWSVARLRLRAHMLASLQLHANETVAVMTLTREAFDRAEATQADSEELVNEPMSTGTIAVAVLLSESDDGRIRVNLRSKSPEVCGVDVDVAAIAERMGGGGHRRAAGVRMAGPLQTVRQRVLDTVLDELVAARRK